MSSQKKSGVSINTKDKKKHRLEHWQVIAIYLVIFDVIAVNFSYFFALLLRFDFRYSAIDTVYLSSFFKFTPIYTLFCLVVFWRVRLYNSLWRFAGIAELNRSMLAGGITTLFQIIGITVFVHRMPISYYVIGAVTQFILVTGVRFSYRFVNLMRHNRSRAEQVKHRAMIIGAGNAGRIVVRELNTSEKSDTQAVCIIDDNPNKWGRMMEGVKIAGGRDDIMVIANKYNVDRIYFCIPTANVSERRDILNLCQNTGCELKTLPGIYQLANGEVSVSKLRPVAIEDLLGRNSIKVDMTGIYQSLQGKVILVTGGGGSIGSELCRQIAAHHPKQLIIFDIYENNAYDIQMELQHKYGDALNLVVLIGSVRDSRRLDMIFEKYHPQIVYHAAAHKHVPLMEDSPNESIKNNVIGTYKTAYMALKYGTEKFVLISTDKAVNPTNIMGASKRLCEMVIQSMNWVGESGQIEKLPLLHAHGTNSVMKMMHDGTVRRELASDPVSHADFDGTGKFSVGHTQFVAVRFGNVLGSNGSVIPLFKKQIEQGGPVTVTHPDIIRYFMTIPEAVSLVLEAGTYAKGGEIFVLDMGQPVKIDTLARNLIKLSGYTPDVDIKIEYTGLRPGEKLFEEKLMAEEGMQKTANDLIHIGKPIPFDVDTFLVKLGILADASYNNDPNIVQKVEEVVSTFHPVGKHPTGEELKKEAL
jgi:FlaA1/EpsC-like NDP-sugar epimerase